MIETIDVRYGATVAIEPQRFHAGEASALTAPTTVIVGEIQR